MYYIPHATMEETRTDQANIQQKLCLATVSSKEYWPGTKAMIQSFLRVNSWFVGELVIITSDRKYIENKLEKHPLRVRLIKPSDELSERIEWMFATQKEFGQRLMKLELFNLTGYDRILYYDSDIIHLAGIDRSVFLNNELLAVSDPWFFRGFVRDRQTLGKVRISENEGDVYRHFFNSGFLMIGKRFINPLIYKTLVSKIEPVLYKDLLDSLADEPVLNAVFENDFQPAPVSNNCPVHLLVEGIIKEPVHSIHFTGRYKPWKFHSWFILPMRSVKYFKFLIDWMKCYLKR